jgi:hypothetical protein
MATKPTRLQEKACDELADALHLIADAARLDGKGTFEPNDLAEVARLLNKASSAFDLDQLVARALERRVRPLGLRSGAVDLLLLMDSDVPPLEMLLLADDQIREMVEAMEAELGEV